MMWPYRLPTFTRAGRDGSKQIKTRITTTMDEAIASAPTVTRTPRSRAPNLRGTPTDGVGGLWEMLHLLGDGQGCL